MISFYNNDYADFNLTLVGGVLIVVLCYISDCLRGYNFLVIMNVLGMKFLFIIVSVYVSKIIFRFIYL